MQNETPVRNEASTSSHSNENASTSSDGFTSLNLSGRPSAPYSGEQSVAYDPAAGEYRAQSISGARWFFWIAALSMINSIIIIMGGNWAFLAGLAITELMSALANGLSSELGGSITVIALLFDLLVAGLFVVFGLFAQKGYTWAFIVGLVFYILDGLLFVFLQEWLSVAFHAFVVYCLIRGVMANQNWKASQAQSTAVA